MKDAEDTVSNVERYFVKKLTSSPLTRSASAKVETCSYEGKT